MSSPLDEAAKLVPDLYYDLIARILPGGSLLAALVFSLPSSALLVVVHEKYGLWFLAFGGYISGMLLTAISSIIVDVILGGIISIKNPTLANTIGGHEHYLKVERTVRSHPEQSVRLWKMVAEKVCIENGIVAVLALRFILPSTSNASEITTALPLVLVGLILAWVLRAISLSGRIAAANEA